jgi:hypothetical protein
MVARVSVHPYRSVCTLLCNITLTTCTTIDMQATQLMVLVPKKAEE